MASTSPDVVGNNTNTRSSKLNPACCIPDFSYPLISSILFISSSSMSRSHQQLYHHRKNTKSCHPSLSVHATIMSWHRVQHSPSTASTPDCLSSLHSQDYELTPECSFSFRRASLHDRPPSASSPWELKGKVSMSHSHGCKLTNWWIESQHLACHPSTASKYLSNLAQSWPPSVSPNSLDDSLQVHLQTRAITASNCISKHARLRPPSLHNHGLQVPISKLARSRPPSESPNSLDHGLQV